MPLIQAKKGDLVLVTDAGSNDYEQHKELSEKGVGVIVLDHH